jgi:hypothetical protein
MSPDIVAGIRESLALVFLLAALLKLAKPQSVISAIAAVRALPVTALRPTAYAVALLEAAAAVLLVAAPGTLGLVLAAFAVIAFSAFLTTLAVRAPTASCGCFGDVSNLGHAGGIARNALLGALLLLAASGQYENPVLRSIPAAVELAIALVLLPDAAEVLVKTRRRAATR